jgi:hypothetical protein
MAAVRFVDVQARPTQCLDLTSLTPDAFEQLMAPFEDAFQAHMARWRLDGQPRTSGQFSVYKHCPLPTPQDRLFFLLTYLKTYSLQVVQGRLFGMSQGKANQWIDVWLPALQVALRTLGATPARSLTALAHRLGVTVAEASATVATPVTEAPEPVTETPGTVTTSSPLLPMTAPRDALCAPKTLLNRPMVIAARPRTTR